MMVLLSSGLAPAQSTPPRKPHVTVGKAAAAGLIDINRASAEQLRTLPGIADAYSAAIIRNRPYANKAQLKSRNVLPAATYNRIKDRIIAKQ